MPTRCSIVVLPPLAWPRSQVCVTGVVGFRRVYVTMSTGWRMDGQGERGVRDRDSDNNMLCFKRFYSVFLAMA